MAPLEVTPDGWNVSDVKLFQIVTLQPALRRYGYLDQLRADVRSWKVLGIWAAGFGFIVWGVVQNDQGLLILGLTFLVFWAVLFRRTVRYLQTATTAVGIVSNLAPHPLSRTDSTALAICPDETEVAVTMPTALVAEILETYGRAEVLFLHDALSEYSLVFAARPVPN